VSYIVERAALKHYDRLSFTFDRSSWTYLAPVVLGEVDTMDVLSDVLRAVQLTGAVFFDMESHSPWVGTTPEASVIAGIVMPEAEHIICFHALLAGSCWVELTDRSEPAIRLEAGDIVVIPKGDAHVLSSSPGLRGEANMAAYRRPPGHSLPMPHVPPGPDASYARPPDGTTAVRTPVVTFSRPMLARFLTTRVKP